MDSLLDILRRKDFQEPSESTDLKKFILDNYQLNVGVQIRDKDIVIIVNSAAAANSLRLHGPELKRAIKTDKRLSFRING